MASTDDSSEKKIYTLAEVQELAADKEKCIMVISNHIYDVTKFMDEHPGGEEVLKEQHGKDASHSFEDVGHSSNAREQMKAYEIGELHPKDAKGTAKSKKPLVIDGTANEESGSSWVKWVIPLVIAVAAVVLFKLLAKPGPDNNRPPRPI